MFASSFGTPGGPSAGRDAYSLFRTPAPSRPAAGAAATASSRARTPGAAQGGASAATPARAMVGAGPALSANERSAGEEDQDVGMRIAAMITELYAYASDPAGYLHSAGEDTSGGEGSANSGSASASVYEAYASSSPSSQQTRLAQKLRRSHTTLMGRLHDQLAALTALTASGADSAGASRGGGKGKGGGGKGRGGGGVGTAHYNDAQFLIWLAATLLRPDGALVKQCLDREGAGGNCNNDNDGDETALQALSRTLLETLEGLAASVRRCLCGGNGGGTEDKDGHGMLAVLLEQNGGSFLRASGGGGDDDDGGDDDHDGAGLRSYLALPSMIEEALNSNNNGAGAGAGASSGGGMTANKRRRLHLHHGGGYAAGTGGRTNANGNINMDGSTPTTTAASTALLAYVLASYLSSESCPFFSSAHDDDDDDDDDDGNNDDDTKQPSLSWDLLRACTVHAAAEMGLVCHLPSVRAGLVCYGLDRLTNMTTSTSTVAASDENENEDEGEDATISGTARIGGLSPVALVELILSDGG